MTTSRMAASALLLSLAVTAQWSPPLVVDPGAPGAGAAGTVATARDPLRGETLVVVSRPDAGGAWTLSARLWRADFAASWPVFVDVDPAHDAVEPTATFTAGRFVVAWQRTSRASGDARIRVHFHDAGVHAPGGTTVDLPDDPAAGDRAPCLGGTIGASARFALLTFRRDPAGGPVNSTTSRSLFAFVDVLALSVGSASDLAAGQPTVDSDWAQVCDGERAGEGWVVVWQEIDRLAPAPFDWNVYGRRVRANGTLGPIVRLGNSDVPDEHGLRPRVAGRDGRYLLTYTVRDVDGHSDQSDGTALRAQRLRWPHFQFLPSVPAHETVAASITGGLTTGDTARASVFDAGTRSHWTIAWTGPDARLRVARLGHDAATVVQHTAWPPPSGGFAGTVPGVPALDCDPVSGDVRLILPTRAAGGADPVVAFDLFAPAATAQAYGSSCAGTTRAAIAGSPVAPHAGRESFGLELRGGRPAAPTWLLVGTHRADLALPGASGCRLLVSVQGDGPWVTYVGTTDSAGDLAAPLALPSAAHGVDLRWQFAQLHGATAWTADALETHIR